MADAEPLPGWERDVLNEQAARHARDAALSVGQAILDAYDRSVLPINAAYLADTLRMVLGAMKATDQKAGDG